ncbi:MAG TPA: hypothetical protein P5526_15525 [Anaerolineae bacterium]|nr:hypothetical protein [Anaerolineae bacterium]MCB0180051.1 hypothetical protein [Anaerolineae bacterium]MCB9105630.1 hypothetical protein [Anaerolineales bacterium]HRV93569.1 hypothetical protein [Anaerolineae bacterium]
MMDWTKQSQEMFKSWTDTQKQMWDSWLQVVQKGGQPFQNNEIWQKTLETWENTVNSTLATQSEWMKKWTGTLSSQQNVPQEFVKWADQTQGMLEQWTGTQQQLWDSWFEMMKKADISKFGESFDLEGIKAFESWQESAKKIQEAQEQMIKMWTSSQPKA